MKKPELLLPVGNTETFYAALEGGADAVYLGLKQFNARERALNFSNQQIPVLIDLAHQKKCKVYITLNTVIKNQELFELIDVLDFLNKINPDAIIIQDWGVYYLIKKLYPKLVVHASTQMANHSSLGANFSHKKGFERVILARELTLNEIKDINLKTQIETEVFVHGALCYSFSGMCNFSSFLGGHGANRGICSQVCRRQFKETDNSQYFFSLKDNQQIENIPEIINTGVSSLKVEGRLKSSDYVYKVAQAYRMVIDDSKQINNALESLETETGRKKTSYFLGNDLKDAITYQSPNTGIFLGKIIRLSNTGFEVETDVKLENDFRIRIKHPKKDEQENLKVKEFEQNGRILKINTDKKFELNSQVYLSGIIERKFSSKLPNTTRSVHFGLPAKNKLKILNELFIKQSDSKTTLFIRIDSLQWMKKIRFDLVDQIIFSFSKDDFSKIDIDSNLIQNYKEKIWIELPHYIPEQTIDSYKSLIDRFVTKGVNKFFLSHISQKLLLPKAAVFSTNENVYTYNDAAIKFLKSEGAVNFCYPVENDKDNIDAYKNKSGILSLYFYPRLFISRMPVKIKNNEVFTGDMGNTYIKTVKDGISYTIPEHPVSFLQYTNSFKKQGYNMFLIDLSFEKESDNRVKTLIKRYLKSEQVQPSFNFNYKRVLK